MTSLASATGAFTACPVALISAYDARLAGVDPSREPTLRRVRHGVYAERDAWARLAPWERYLARVHTVALTWDAPVFALESAAALHGLPIFGEPAAIHLWDRGGTSYRRGDVAVHASSDARAVGESAGVRATGLADTALDLARALPPAHGLAVADATLRCLSTTADECGLAGHAERQRSRRGMRLVRWIHERATGLAESVGESVARAAIEWLGYEAPELQREFRAEGFRDRSDFFWPRARVIGESDGYGKYDAEDVSSAREHFVREKRREDRLRRQVAGFARWDLADVRAWERLDHILRSAGLHPVRRRQHAMLATLSTDPRSLHSQRA